MAIFLKTNTTDRDAAINTALQMAVFYDADVCIEQDKDDKSWYVVLKSSNLEVPMANVGKEKEQAFLEEAQARLTLFDSEIKFTELKRLRWVTDLENSGRLSNEWRMCLLFSFDKSKAKETPADFAKKFHDQFFSQSEMHLIYADGDRFEVRVRQKAFLGFKDAKAIWASIKGIMANMGDTALGITCDKLVCSSDPISQLDFAITGEKVQRTTFYKTHHFDPLYFDESNKEEWLSRALKIKQLKVTFKSAVYTSADLEKDQAPAAQATPIKQSVFAAGVVHGDHTSYRVDHVFLAFIANPNNEEYLAEMLKGEIVAVNLILTPHPQTLNTLVIDGIETSRTQRAVREGNLYHHLALLMIRNSDLKQACFEGRSAGAIQKGKDGTISFAIETEAKQQLANSGMSKK